MLLHLASASTYKVSVHQLTYDRQCPFLHRPYSLPPFLFYLDSAIHFHLWQQKPQDKIVTKRIIFQINGEIDLKLYYLSACSKVQLVRTKSSLWWVNAPGATSLHSAWTQHPGFSHFCSLLYFILYELNNWAFHSTLSYLPWQSYFFW